MAESHIEREVKLDVDEDFVVPDLSDQLGVAKVERIDRQLQSRYFDTDRQDLREAAMSLRHRTGETQPQWQLKVPHPPAREEIRVAAGGGETPLELRNLLSGVTRGAELRPIASIESARAVHRLLGSDGEPLAEIADDRVQGTTIGGTAMSTVWREVEVELAGGDEALLDALVKRLRRAGARHTPHASKLSRALGLHSAFAPRADRAGDAVLAYLIEQRRALLAGDVALRREDDAAVHQTRVAVRRMRSMLRSYDALFEPGANEALDAELKWFAELLGQVRDRQVLRRRLTGRVDALPPELVIGPVKSQIDAKLSAEQAEHWMRLQEELGAARYLALLTRLAEWTLAPPWSKKAGKSTSYLTTLAGRTRRKAKRSLHAAAGSDDVEAFHDARKAAKRARYAYELLEAATGSKSARKRAKHQLELQELLGEHQDSRVSADVLRRMSAALDPTSRDSGFTFGILYEREQGLARSLRQAASSR